MRGPTPGLPDATADANGNSTVDFGFYRGTRLRLVKKSSRRAVVRGGEVTFTMRVTNVGRTDALTVRVCDRLPGSMTVVKATGATFKNGAICWSISRLAPGASREYRLIAKVDLTAKPGRHVNVATARGSNTNRARATAVVRVRKGGTNPVAIPPGGGVTG